MEILQSESSLAVPRRSLVMGTALYRTTKLKDVFIQLYSKIRHGIEVRRAISPPPKSDGFQ